MSPFTKQIHIIRQHTQHSSQKSDEKSKNPRKSEVWLASALRNDLFSMETALLCVVCVIQIEYGCCVLVSLRFHALFMSTSIPCVQKVAALAPEKLAIASKLSTCDLWAVCCHLVVLGTRAASKL